MNCVALTVVPEWLGQFVHLGALHLNGVYFNDTCAAPNRVLTALPALLGA